MVKEITKIKQHNTILDTNIRRLGGYYLSLLFYINYFTGEIDFTAEDINKYYFLFLKKGFLDKSSLPKSPCLILEYFGFIRPRCRYERVLTPIGNNEFSIYEVYINSLDTVHHIAKCKKKILYDSRDMASLGIKSRNISKRVFSYLSINAQYAFQLP
ncbi:DUF261 family protein (plasmid) [Borrelia sp. A-FGy1]|uniref:DUF261 family protein n=1 Tax=Borrelia sp. A-FGy1 TaxID=2608247 RepID=UPI0015F4488F|nr:DUF261 family protein [Borrelia sp. A-FGy1]QMU99783.1 DUF261 family protein [Borrelia sp. A-FGy1]